MHCHRRHRSLLPLYSSSPPQSVSLANVEGNTPLHWACLNNQKEAARLLLAQGASASALNRLDMTPVDEALIRGYQDIVDLINDFSAPAAGGSAEGVEEVDDVPDDAMNAEDSDMTIDESEGQQ